MNRLIATVLLALFVFFFYSSRSSAQQEETEGTRKIVSRVMPRYPEMARTLNLRGSVKAEAVVKPNGQVKSVDVRGGHPILVRAAENAIYRWRWEPAAHESREPIEVRFDPQQ
jgi:TonB family protein